ncbi:MAG: S-layer homology domain-containing protein [Oscillospiraceae bacterium]
MIKRHKIFAFFIAFAMSLQILSFGVFANAGGALRLTIGVNHDTVKPGDTIEATVYFDFMENKLENGGVHIAIFGVKYDPNIFEPVKVDGQYAKAGEILKSDGVDSGISDTNANVINIFFGGPNTTDVTQSGAFAVMTFKVKDTAANCVSKFDFAPKIDIITPTKNETTGDYEKFRMASFGKEVLINPPFSYTMNSTVEKGDSLVLDGKSSVSPLKLIFMDPNGATVKEVEIPVNDGTFKYSLLIDKSFVSGRYKLYVKNSGCMIDNTIQIKDKNEDLPPEPIQTPAPSPTPTAKPAPLPTFNPGGDDGSGKATPAPSPSATAKPSENNPSDISDHWAEGAIKYAYEKNLMTGYEDNTFNPEGSITRGEFVTVMYRYMGLSKAEGKVFADTSDHWAKDYIMTLYSMGIVGGVSEDEFEPDAPIEREQMAAILDRTFKFKETTEMEFADEDLISDWAIESVYRTLKSGIMKGDENNNFAPRANATRAEVATIISRLPYPMN